MPITIRNIWGDGLLEVPGNNLRGAIIAGADLQEANLIKANLCNAVMIKANLRDASLGGAVIVAANLTDASARWADLRGADLSSADLYHTDFTGSRLDGANLTGANLVETVGNGREIKSLQCGPDPVAYTADTMQIGHQRHLITEWWEFDDRTIGAMGGRQMLEWWNTWKPILQTIIAASPATPTGHEVKEA